MRLDDLHALGFDVDQGAHTRLARFVDLLLEENQKLNLTGIKTVEGVWTRHIVDSLAALPLLDAMQPETIVDLGSGGGVPGLPLACARPDIRVTLIDATAKKIAAVQRIIDALPLTNAHPIAGRAEVLAHQPTSREQFDFLTARAVGALAPLLEWSAGLVRPEGQCCFYKSLNNLEAELEAAESAARACRLDYDATLIYALPGDLGERALVTYTKVDHLPKNLPRPPWRAKGRAL